MGILGWIIIGIIAGWIAEKIMGRNHGLLTNLVVGVVGAFLGGFLATQFGFGDINNDFWGTLLVATAGAVLLLFILGLVGGRRTTI